MSPIVRGLGTDQAEADSDLVTCTSAALGMVPLRDLVLATPIILGWNVPSIQVLLKCESVSSL
jgi:hypothetical protein